MSALVVMSAPASATNFWEDLFGFPPSRTDGAGASAPYRAAPPRRAKAAKASSGFTIRNHVRVVVSHGDAIATDYLKSAEFTQLFNSTAPGATKEALTYLLKHDPTLQPGDAVVTRAGVVVLDADQRKFAPASKTFDKSLRERLLAFSAPKASPLERTAVQTASDETQAPLAFSIRVSDGQPIRYVGGL
ncbi:hypothetical protein M2323_003856 [Rhodoblastus acidophilus]|uniref:hypothetical protein n=1 Tax=Rhodoblastus acidophilus TaxID=1074 RepID=UPI00222442E7|nr:hypothetical protein [Rhodoblastus acidophilus]MCW2286019.1 hypothetical protein [Rhodoblastus acidophilus]MCW2334913.1 hypothetical protein [Rhodoblastus acidophilus]